jgi:hypothetical protein
VKPAFARGYGEPGERPGFPIRNSPPDESVRLADKFEASFAKVATAAGLPKEAITKTRFRFGHFLPFEPLIIVSNFDIRISNFPYSYGAPRS